MKRLLLLAVMILSVGLLHSNANTVTINNTTNAQYQYIIFDNFGGVLMSSAIGAMSSATFNFGGANAARTHVTMGGASTPGDMVDVGHFTTGFPPFASSANTYPWLGGSPFSVYWNQPGATPVTNVIMTIL